jgi:hypothetical protein
MNRHYITYYWMWTRLLATGVIPFVLLALLNSKIFLAIRKSKQQLRSLAIRYNYLKVNLLSDKIKQKCFCEYFDESQFA